MTAEPLRACRLRFGVYELDPRGGELWREGLPVHIPPQPFKVLWLLASRAGDVVTREEIRQELWGNDTFVDFDGGLNFCINQIRKALRDNAESPRFIHTLPRRGYRFIASVERVPLPAAETPERPREAASEVADAADTKADTQQEGGDGTDEGAGPRPPRARASHLYEVVSEGEGEASRRWRPTGGPARVRLASSPIALEEPSAVDAEEPLPHGIAVEKRSEEPGAPPPPAVAPAPAVPTGAAPGPAVPPPAARRRLLAVTWPWIAVAMALSAAVIAVAVARHQSEPAYERVTFHRGTVATARFTPGGGVAYSAMWEGAGRQVFLTRPGEAQSRPIPVPDRTLVQSALASGELAVLLVRETGYVLALLPTGGGAPRELVADLSGADVSPDGARIAVVRGGPEDRVEMPPGHEIYHAPARISGLRLSPAGDRVAFFEHPVPGDDRGSVVTVTSGGERTALSEGWASLEGLAWGPDGTEVWFTGARVGADSALHAVSLAGEERVVTRGPGRLVLHDLRSDGAALIERTTRRVELRGLFPGDEAERDLSWLDLTFLTDLAPDGRSVVFSESGEGGGAAYGVYLRPTDGGPPVRLGDGRAMTRSPDGRWVLSVPLFGPPRIVALPTGPGEPRTMATGLTRHAWAVWFPDGASILFAAAAPGQALRVYVQDLAGGSPRPVTENTALLAGLVQPDGRRVLTRRPGFKGEWHFDRLDGPGRERAPLQPLDRPLAFTPDGRALLVQPPWRSGPIVVDRVDLATGTREPHRELPVADPALLGHVASLRMTADGLWYAYSAHRHLSDLYLVRGLR